MYEFFGYGFFSFLAELVILVILFAMINIPFLVILPKIDRAMRRRGIRPPKRHWVYELGLAVSFVWLLASHFLMSHELAPTKQLFTQTAATVKPTHRLKLVGGESMVVADYQGALDRVVAIRNKKLAERGYIILGDWWVYNGESLVYATYVKVPWR
jgi:hypothetical protein